MNPELDFPPERMRQIGYRVVDRIVDHLATLRDQPVDFLKQLLELDVHITALIRSDRVGSGLDSELTHADQELEHCRTLV